MILNDLQKLCYSAAKRSGHYDREWDLPGLLMMVTCELAEAVEADREGQDFAEELADSLIVLLGVCEHHGIDTTAEILRKMRINEQRDYLHGKKY